MRVEYKSIPRNFDIPLGVIGLTNNTIPKCARGLPGVCGVCPGSADRAIVSASTARQSSAPRGKPGLYLIGPGWPAQTRPPRTCALRAAPYTMQPGGMQLDYLPPHGPWASQRRCAAHDALPMTRCPRRAAHDAHPGTPAPRHSDDDALATTRTRPRHPALGRAAQTGGPPVTRLPHLL
jgi:hypothetical protein